MADQETDYAEIRRRLRAAEQHRKSRFEPLWHECLAFASGRQVRWQGAGPYRRMVAEPVKDGYDRYLVDELAQYRQTVLGELSLDDDRPQLVFRHDNRVDQDFAQQANDAVSYGWDYEWDADQTLKTVRRHLIDVGTAAVRCWFDPTKGPTRAEVPHFQGNPIYDKQQAFQILDEGGQITLKDIHEGRTRWQPGSAFNLLVPPGIAREEDFPWECWVDTVYLPTLRERFSGADNLRADAIAPLTSVQPDDENSEGQQGRTTLDDHVWLYSYFERPTKRFPDGRVVHMAGDQMRVVQVDKKLPYVAPDGTARSGIHYFHYIRLSDRFWSRSMMELGLQATRQISKRRTQVAAIIDRGQPKVIVEEGTLKKPPSGAPAEILWLKTGKPQPQVWAGIPPGAWMQQEVDALRTDLERAIGLRVALGENPPNVGTYSQLALLRETETRKLDVTISENRSVVSRLVEDAVYDIKTYWPSDKQVAVAGSDGMLRAFEFDSTRLNDAFYRVESAKGAPKPRTQAARLQMVQDIAQFALNTGAARLNPVEWTRWFADSQDQGEPVELPVAPPDYQRVFAEYAKAMLAQGQMPPVLEYISPDVLIPAVREVQTEAALSQNMPVLHLCAQFLQQILLQHQQQLADQAQQTAGALGQSGLAQTMPPLAPSPALLAAAAPPGGPGLPQRPQLPPQQQ